MAMYSACAFEDLADAQQASLCHLSLFPSAYGSLPSSLEQEGTNAAVQATWLCVPAPTGSQCLGWLRGACSQAGGVLGGNQRF